MGHPDEGWRAGAWGMAALFGAAGIALTVVAVTLLNPPKNEPVAADVVVVIAGSSDGRHELARGMVNDGVADNLVVSNPSGARDGIGSALCRGEGVAERVDIWCMKPEPSTTTGEVQTFEKLARGEGWQTAVAVTNRPHHYRVRMNFAQCSSVRATVVSVQRMNWPEAPYLVAREIGGFLKHFLTRPC